MSPILEIFLILILPTIIWTSKLIPPRFMEWSLTLVSALFLIPVFLGNWSLFKLGVRFDNLSSVAVPYLLMTVLSVVFIIFVGRINKRRFIPAWRVDRNAFFWVTLGSILQEFIYRGYLMPKLGEIFSSLVLIILVNAVLFTIVHFIFPELISGIPVIFIGGVMFATMYAFYPNLIMICIMHMILNFTATSYGFFTLKPELHKLS
jgi:membrane protease YdiL (CAAX protease family)